MERTRYRVRKSDVWVDLRLSGFSGFVALCEARCWIDTCCRRIPNTTLFLEERQSSDRLFAPVAMHWVGGRHHARKNEASGFCCVNDVVLGILRLSERFDRTICIDVDIHHGDGLEEAFNYTSNVLTISFHMRQPGFFPGTGDINSVGKGRAKYANINVPFKQGITDEQYVDLFETVVKEAAECMKPDAFVMVCGTDCLHGDPLGGTNLSIHRLERCVKKVIEKNKPLLLLGGGGYDMQSPTRAIAVWTACALDVELQQSIPTLSVSYTDKRLYYLCSWRIEENRNTDEELREVKRQILTNMRRSVRSCKNHTHIATINTVYARHVYQNNSI